ncbi:hypothetical protein Lal_00048952 [Lupinus albus]|nr:hypothetical protein Lal_00048952 [Lupinus albus]
MENFQIWSKTIRVGAIAFAVALIFVSASANDVVVLSEDNFQKEIGHDKGALVEFYAPWGGHCKKLAPEYEKLGSSFKKSKSVVIDKVSTQHPGLLLVHTFEYCLHFLHLLAHYFLLRWTVMSIRVCAANMGSVGTQQFSGFPKGSLEPKKYEGPRNAEALAEFVNTEGGTNVKIATGPSNVVVLTAENFNEVVLDETKDVLVEFYAAWYSPIGFVLLFSSF